MLEGRTTLELVQIANSGAGFELRASGRTTLELVQIANAAAAGGGTIFMRGLSGRTTLELVQIGNASKGHVDFADPLPD